MKVAVLTISTSGSKGLRPDSSGDLIVAWANDRHGTVVERHLLPDEVSRIVPWLAEQCDSGAVDLILTTGGTGLSPSDLTPEATRAVIEREASGIAELLRVRSLNRFPKAALSRGIAGIRGKTLIVNLPGSPGGVRDGLAALDEIVHHAVAVTRGEIRDHEGNE